MSGTLTWFPTAGELLQERIVTRVVNGFEFALSGMGSAQMGPDQVERVLMGTAKYAAIRRVNPDAYAKIAEIFAKELQRGMSIADLHREIYPIGLAVVSDVLPHASPHQLIDFARFMIGVGKKLNADSSGSRWAGTFS